MKPYFVKTPFWLKLLYPSLIWQMPAGNKTIYLTFDDGPQEEATPFVLNELKKFNAKATFFCVGNNVMKNPDIFKMILSDGHAIGNHTQHHLNGWQTPNEDYFNNIAEAQKIIQSKLFRPPYGKIKRFQIKYLRNLIPEVKIIMWSVLSADFDTLITPQQCAENVIWNSKPGSIIVFHDSQKALPNLHYALPRVLQYFSEKGYRFESINGLK